MTVSRRNIRSACTLLIVAMAGCARDAVQTAPASSQWPFNADSTLLAGNNGNPFNPGQTTPSLGEKLTSWLPKPSPTAETNTNGSAATKTDPKTALMARARLLERQGDVKTAREIYQAILQQYPAEVLPYHRLGIIAAKEGRLGEAEEFLLIAQQMTPPTVELLSDYGYLLYLQNRLDESERVLRDALAREPFHRSANTNLGLVLGMQRRFPESLAAFKRAGSEAEAHANLAYTLTQLGELAAAKEQYLRALKLDNSMRPAANALLQLVEREDAQLARQSEQRRQTAVAAGATSTSPRHAASQQLVADIQPSGAGPVIFQATQPVEPTIRRASGEEPTRLPPVSYLAP